MSNHNLPALPEGQRWYGDHDINGAPVVKLQEKRWWGWKTIGRSHYFNGNIGWGAQQVLKDRAERAAAPVGPII